MRSTPTDRAYPQRPARRRPPRRAPPGPGCPAPGSHRSAGPAAAPPRAPGPPAPTGRRARPAAHRPARRGRPTPSRAQGRAPRHRPRARASAPPPGGTRRRCGRSHGSTRISRRVAFTYITKSSRLSATMSRVSTDCTSGTDAARCGGRRCCRSWSGRAAISTKVARKTAKVALVIRLRTKSRTTRGLNCPLAICTGDQRDAEHHTDEGHHRRADRRDHRLRVRPRSAADRRASVAVAVVLAANGRAPRRAAWATSHTTKTPTMAAVGANQNVSRRCSLSGDNARGRRRGSGPCVTIQSLRWCDPRRSGAAGPGNAASGKETQVKGTAKPWYGCPCRRGEAPRTATEHLVRVAEWQTR